MASNYEIIKDKMELLKCGACNGTGLTQVKYSLPPKYTTCWYCYGTGWNDNSEKKDLVTK